MVGVAVDDRQRCGRVDAILSAGRAQPATWLGRRGDPVFAAGLSPLVVPLSAFSVLPEPFDADFASARLSVR
jgi:hypothetical protein